MKISVKNFGPIREAKDIQLAPMTLFVGPSNTGKSYLATLLYSVVKILAEAGEIMGRRGTSHMRLQGLFGDALHSHITLRDAEKLTMSVLHSWAAIVGDEWRLALPYYFGEEGRELAQTPNMSVVVSSDDDGISLDLAALKNSRMNSCYKSAAGRQFIRLKNKHVTDEEPELSLFTFFHSLFVDSLSPNEDAGFHYLPAIRGSVMQNHRMLVGAIMEQAPLAGLTDTSSRRLKSSPVLTGVVSDFVRKLIDLPGMKRTDMSLSQRLQLGQKITDIGNRMESAIMAGGIQVKMSETGYPDYRYQFSKGKSLSLNNTSSMVAELAPVSIFLRYHIDDGDLFIVEEPEAHLHPGGQRAICEVLAQLANAGVFVLATTHSDVILEQISNFVHASRTKGTAVAKRRAAKIARAVLTEEQAAVYSFATGGKRGTVVKKVAFDSTTGIVSQDHLDESTNLYNQTVRLLNGQSDG